MINLNIENKNYIQIINELFFQASSLGHVDLVRFLLSQGAEIDFVSYNKSTSLYISAQNGHANVVKLLLENKAKTEIKASTGLTALYIATQNQHINVMNLLLKFGSNIEFSFNEFTALHLASVKGYFAGIKLLLEYGASNNKLLSNKSLLKIVNNNLKVVKLLQGESLVEEINKNDALLCSLSNESSDLAMITQLLNKGANVNVKCSFGMSPLESSSLKKKYEVTKKLIDNGASAKEVFYIDDVLDRTQLILGLYNAATEGNVRFIKKFIESNGDVNAIYIINNIEASALHFASQNGHQDVVKMLLDAGANVNARTSLDGSTALFMASKNGHFDVARLLLEAGADTEIAQDNFVDPTESHHTPLYGAVYNKHQIIVELLVKYGAKVFSDDYIDVMMLSATLELKDIHKILVDKHLDNLNKNKRYFNESISEINFDNNAAAFEVVVVRFDEDLSWISSEFPYQKVTIYNKGEDDIGELNSNCKVIKIDNKGYVSGTYLYHMVLNYNNLANKTLFTQGYPYDSYPILPMNRYKEDLHFRCDQLTAKCAGHMKLLDNSNYLKSRDYEHGANGKYRHFNHENNDLMKFAELHLGNDLPETSSPCNAEVFSVTKEQIRGRSIEFYEDILTPMTNRYSVEAFYLEILWDLIFKPTTNILGSISDVVNDVELLNNG